MQFEVGTLILKKKLNNAKSWYSQFLILFFRQDGGIGAFHKMSNSTLSIKNVLSQKLEYYVQDSNLKS